MQFVGEGNAGGLRSKVIVGGWALSDRVGMQPLRYPLFEIEVGDPYHSRFAYASGYTPLPDRKSFVPPASEEHNRQFTELNGFKPAIRISPASRWPDFLF